MTKFMIGADEWAGISKLTEEAGEVLQVCGKLLGTNGERHHWDGSDLASRLEEEIADTVAAMQFVCDHSDGKLSEERIAERAQVKLALFEQWHRERTRP